MAVDEKGGTKITLIESHLEKEAAAVLGKLLGASADGAVSTFGDIFGGLFGDRIRQWRTRNLISTLARTAEFLKAKGIPLSNVKALPDGELYALFEGASRKDEPNVADLYSALLVNAMANEVKASQAIIDTLNALGSNEVRILEYLWKLNLERSSYRSTSKPTLAGRNVNEIKSHFEKVAELHNLYIGNMTDADASFSLQVLLSKQCVSQIVAASPRISRPSMSDDNKPASVRAVYQAYEQIHKSEERLSEYLKGDVVKRIKLSVGDASRRYPNVELTAFGMTLMTACHCAEEAPPA